MNAGAMAHHLAENNRQSEQTCEILKKFRQIFKAVQQHSQRVESQCGVSSAQLWALWLISGTPGVRVSDLAQTMSVHQSTASNLLDKLDKSGFIRKDRNGSDQRVVRIFLTDEGQMVLDKAPKPVSGILQNALFGLPEELLIALNQDLGFLLESMSVRDEITSIDPPSGLQALN
jgi:DNA-binding MarR family transcriptional regulator